MKMSKLSNQTNSQDPQAVNSRIFVGNLNTFQCSKTDVERMFQIYGRLAGISMHKGYAFVQFTNPFDARNACHGEDGRTVLSQTLDVNMVAEPKAHQIGRKRQNVSKTGNDWDYFYDSYCSSTLLRSSGVRPKKRKRLMTTTSRLLSDAVNSNNLNAAVVAAAAQQQQLHQQQQQQQQQHHHHHHQHAQQQQQQQQQHHQQHQQQQVAAVAMAAMAANLLPQQQLLLHQQNLLSNANSAAAAAAAAAAANCNGATTTTSHHSLNVFLQQQQQLKQQHQQQHQHQQQAAGQYAAVAAAAAAAAGLQLKSSSVQNATSAIIAAANQTTTLSNGNGSGGGGGGGEAAAFGCIGNGQTHLQQPLTLTMPPLHQQQQQQHQLQQQQEQLTSNQQWGPFKVYSNPDTLICGNCRECFNELAELLDHKRSYCKLRFTCKCQDVALPAKTPPTSAKLLCAVCKDAFANPWDLMVHAQAAHMVNIYELGNEANNNGANCGEVIMADATAPNIANSNNSNNNNNNVSGSCTAGQSDLAVKEAQPAASVFNKESNSGNTINNTNNNSSSCSSRNEIQMSPTTPAATAAAATSTTKLENVDNGSGDVATMAVSAVDAAAGEAPTAGIVVGGHGNNGVGGGGAYAADGNVSDTEAAHCMDVKFGICHSPHGSMAKEDSHRDDGSLDEHMSNSSHTHHSDDMKLLNGSLSSRGSSPALDGEEPHQQPARACIVRTLSIEAASASAPSSHTATLGLMTNSLGLSLTNGAANAAAAIAPQ